MSSHFTFKQLDTQFNAPVGIGKTQETSLFSTDDGRTWTANKVNVVNGKAKIMFMDSKPGTAGVALLSDKAEPTTVAIEVTIPSGKTLEMTIKTDMNEEKTLKFQFGR